MKKDNNTGILRLLFFNHGGDASLNIDRNGVLRNRRDLGVLAMRWGFG